MATNGEIDPITQQQIQIGQLMVQNGQLIIERAQMMQRIAELTAANLDLGSKDPEMPAGSTADMEADAD